jgi:hypothetical protein
LHAIGFFRRLNHGEQDHQFQLAQMLTLSHIFYNSEVIEQMQAKVIDWSIFTEVPAAPMRRAPVW